MSDSNVQHVQPGKPIFYWQVPQTVMTCGRVRDTGIRERPPRKRCGGRSSSSPAPSCPKQGR
eukprot:CAMPEP_0118835860 /NCGR_PEP_ID=MMETSP1162-20130426/56140_1 /TAXON_ID=33656 /ORGANISM="Phaeocystis Sp, Strain CCMP2710" /LENGTH=61 /DNA_ID=CAMNT_0006767647 /DNA_START=21 /DNA_END=202 /DNA_ORIENTATION=-